jgi:hypothetical protein
MAAGISLGAFSAAGPIEHLLTEEDARALRDLAGRSLFFGSRGCLTHSFLKAIGVDSILTGDVAFYEPRFSQRRFAPPDRLERIAVSDPHYSAQYRESFVYLVNRLKEIFPGARIDLLVHKAGDEAHDLATECDIPCVYMFSPSERGLDTYDGYDIHVGYRVHGHVSALVRRKPSYFIEQDDRGTDYGATLSRRVSVASHRNLSRKTQDGSKQALTAPIETLVAIMRQDLDQGFSRFVGLEREIEAFGDMNLAGLRGAIEAISSRTDQRHPSSSPTPA